MEAKKSNISPLRMAFNKAVVAGLTALTLGAGGVSGAYADHYGDAQPQGGTQTSAPWQNTAYDREMQLAQNTYSAQMKAAKANYDARVSQCSAIAMNQVGGAMQSRKQKNDFWKRVIIPSGNNGSCNAQAESSFAQQQASYDVQLAQLQASIESRYAQQYQQKADQEARLNQQKADKQMAEQQRTQQNSQKLADNSFEAQKLKVCQQRELSALQQGKSLPAGDACNTVLGNNSPSGPKL